MSDTQVSRSAHGLRAIQDNAPRETIRAGRVVGLILHAHGTLRLFEDRSNGRLAVEVIGMRSPQARGFLALLDDLCDVTSEILVCDAPEVYPLDEPPVRSRHARRDA